MVFSDSYNKTLSVIEKVLQPIFSFYDTYLLKDGFLFLKAIELVTSELR